MSNSTSSAAYFCKTTEVEDFLKEYIRFRKKVLNVPEPEEEDEDHTQNGKNPYRRAKFSEASTVSEDAKPKDLTSLSDCEDNLLNVAVQMTMENDLHLDAFISLVDSYDLMVKENPEMDHLEFKLAEILKNAKITRRKFPVIEDRVDIEWSKKLAHEIKYQRQTKDIRELFTSQQNKVFEFRPPIISGLNIIFGVALTFIGAYSISGSLGVKDPLHRTLIGIAFSFVALIVDTVLYLLRPNV
ncbi:hypothetical protein MACK_001699 [Theileria orientalis]|uniref:Uncharacterized protein n=1 Tax=Theileria orientalis TaxID=68886 RepID=A0A976MDE8_THEOR|nr:hypothetical protein MACK_001699 [Theileria orientalis]